jgi:hypothetical protein
VGAFEEPAADVVEGAVGERTVGQDDGDATAGRGEAPEEFEEENVEALGAAEG